MKGKYAVKNVLDKIAKRQSLAGADLRNLYLTCMDFSDMDLRLANFDGCHLSFAIMNGSNLSNGTKEPAS